MEGSPGGPAREEEAERPQPIEWSPRRGRYALLLALLLAAAAGTVAARILAQELAVLPAILTALVAVPGVLSLQVLLGATSYRLESDRLDVVKGGSARAIELGAVTGFFPPPDEADRASGSALTITIPGGVLSLPRWIDADRGKLYSELFRRTGACLARVHAAKPEGAAWPFYNDVPPELAELISDLRARGTDAGAMLFAGPHRKVSTGARGARRFFLFLTTLFALLAVAVGTPGEKEAVIGLASTAGVCGVIVFLTYASSVKTKGREWLLVHKEGLAMVGKGMTGELDWEEVTEIGKIKRAGSPLFGGSAPPSSSGTAFFMKTSDGASIPVADRFDAPLPFVCSLCRRCWRKTP